jgi:tetratricopeptide (TPR) repeat protein
MYELKRLTAANLEAAIAKAAHYRDLNQPEEAESICRDVLDVDTTHQTAWKILGLAITDRFASGEVGLLEAAIEAFEKLGEEYERVYHIGVAWERAAKAHLERGEAHSAVTAFEHALELFASHPQLLAAIDDPREHQVHLGD